MSSFKEQVTVHIIDTVMMSVFVFVWVIGFACAIEGLDTLFGKPDAMDFGLVFKGALWMMIPGAIYGLMKSIGNRR